MGYAILAKKTNVQISAQIRKVAKDSSAVIIVDHASGRMLARRVGINEVYEVLRHGTLVRPWWINKKYDSFECRMEHYVGGRELAVGVSLNDDDPAIVVVTVITN